MADEDQALVAHTRKGKIVVLPSVRFRVKLKTGSLFLKKNFNARTT
jgi:hypothetical protein